MNARLAIVSISLLATSWTVAQNIEPKSTEDSGQAAISDADLLDFEEPSEVITPDDEQVPESAADTGKTEPSPEAPPKASVLVTGTPDENSEIVDEDAPAESAEEAPPAAEIAEAPAPKPRKGLSVRVANLRAGSGNIDPSQVKLLAPFPAKPLAQPPAGWHLEASEEAPPFTREVELSPGKHITLTVRPHLLVPDTDGVGVFTVPEPGFDPSLGYRQDATVGAVLSKSIRQLDDDSRELGNVIENLQQLLVSLPNPEPAPEQ